VTRTRRLQRFLGPGPYDRAFYDLYRRAGENIERVTGLLDDYIQAWPDADPQVRLTITDCEHEGDRITHDIMHYLHTRTVTPIPVREAHVLASQLDDVVDFAEEVADFFRLYRIEAPTDGAIELAGVLRRAGIEVAAAMRTLNRPAETRPHAIAIDNLEHEGDRMVRSAVAGLFERGIDPMVVIRLKDVYERLEDAIDACDDIAHTLDGLRHAV
jgi:uncharacterized protein